MFLHISSKIRSVKFVSSPRRPKLRAEAAWKREENVFIDRRTCMVMLQRRTTKVLNEKTNLVATSLRIVAQDLHSYWNQSNQTKNKIGQETMTSLQKMFLPPDPKPGIIHTENSPEFFRACEDLCRNHDKSTRYRSETNGIAKERSPLSNRRYFCSSGSVRSFRKVVERSGGMLFFAKHARQFGRQEVTE